MIYSSFHFLFHYPYTVPIYYLVASCSFHFLFHYPYRTHILPFSARGFRDLIYTWTDKDLALDQADQPKAGLELLQALGALDGTLQDSNVGPA